MPSVWWELLVAVRKRIAHPFRAFAGEPDEGSRRAVRAPITGPATEPEAGARRRAMAGDEVDERVARSMVEALLPTSFPPHEQFELFGATAPAKFVGGDFFDFFFNGQGRLVLVLADASGKGVPAAMFVSATRAVIRDLAMATKDGGSGSSPGEILARANTMLVGSNPQGMFVTAVLASVEPATGRVEFACAGHPPPLVLDRNGKARDAAGPRGGTVMGAMEDLEFPQGGLVLERGDRLLLYSDGVIEARAEGVAGEARGKGKFLGREGLVEVCERSARMGTEDLCHAVLSRVAEFQKGRLHDDATVLVLRRK